MVQGQGDLQSRRYDLFRRLDSKLLLESGEARGFPPLVSREVVIVVDATDLLLDTNAENVSLDLSGGSSAYVAYFTVPAGERWHLTWAVREATTANSHVEIRIAKDAVALQLTGDATAIAFFPMNIFTIDEGDSIGMIESGDPADSGTFMSLLYRKELTT